MVVTQWIHSLLVAWVNGVGVVTTECWSTPILARNTGFIWTLAWLFPDQSLYFSFYESLLHALVSHNTNKNYS